MGLLISRTELFSQPAFLKKPFVFVVRYCHFNLINLLLLNYSTAAFRFTVIIHFFNYRFPTLFTYKETILFCPNKIFFLFTATLWPFLSSLPFFFSRTSHRGCQVKAQRQARNILAQLCFALDDSQHYRSLGVDASFFSPYPGIPILLHTLLFLSYFLFSFNKNKTIFVITYDAITYYY